MGCFVGTHVNLILGVCREVTRYAQQSSERRNSHADSSISLYIFALFIIKLCLSKNKTDSCFRTTRVLLQILIFWGFPYKKGNEMGCFSWSCRILIFNQISKKELTVMCRGHVEDCCARGGYKKNVNVSSDGGLFPSSFPQV